MRHARDVVGALLLAVVLLTPLAAAAQSAPDPCATLAGSALAGPAGCGPGSGTSSTTTTTEPTAVPSAPAPESAPPEPGSIEAPPTTAGGGFDAPAPEPLVAPEVPLVDDAPLAGSAPATSPLLASTSDLGDGASRDTGRVLLAFVVALVVILYLGIRGAHENRARAMSAAEGTS